MNLYNFVKNSNIADSLRLQMLCEVLLGSNLQNKFVACNDDKQYQLYQINIFKDNEDQFQINVTKIQAEPKFVNALYSNDAFIYLNSKSFAHSDYKSNYYIFDYKQYLLQIFLSENNNVSSDQKSVPNGTEEFLIINDSEYQCPFLPNVKYVFASSCTVSALPWKTQYLNVSLGSLNCQILHNLKELHSLVMQECECEEEVDLSLTNLTKVVLTCVQIKKLKLPNSLKYFTADHPKFDLQESISNTLELELFQLSSMKTEYANSGVKIPLQLEELFILCWQVSITQLQNMQQLRKLELIYVEETYPLDLTDCTNLIYLYICQCKFASVSAPHLLNLYLVENSFNCIDPAANLVKMHIVKQNFSQPLEKFPLLEDLQISVCKITNPLTIENTKIKRISIEYSDTIVTIHHNNFIQNICFISEQVIITGIENCLLLQSLSLIEFKLSHLNLKYLNYLTTLDIHSSHINHLILYRIIKVIEIDESVDHRQLYPLEHMTQLESPYALNSFAEFRATLDYTVKDKIRTDHPIQIIMDQICYKQCDIHRKITQYRELCHLIQNKVDLKERILSQMRDVEELVKKWQ